MKAFRNIDTVLVVLMTPVWLLCVVLHGRLVWQDRLSWVPVYVEAAPELGGLQVTGLWPDSDPATVGVQPGDVLLQVGEASTRDWTRLAFLRGVYDRVGGDRAVDVVLLRDGEQRAGELRIRPIAHAWRTVPLVIGLGVMGLLLPLRGRGARAARAWALAGIALSLHWSLLFAFPGWQSSFGLPFFIGGAALVYPFFLRAVLLTPGSLRPAPARWALLLPWVFAINGPAMLSWLIGVPWSGETGLRVIFVVNNLALVIGVAILVRNYLRSDAAGRRKIKWVVLGMGLGGAPVIATAALAAVEPQLWWLYEISLIATVLMPICIFIAFFRDNFLDINRLLSTTAVYSVLSVLVLSVVLYVVPLVSGQLSAQTGLSGGAVQAMLSVVLAAIIVPAERVVRPSVERLVFRERAALEDGLKEIRGAMGRADSPSKILTTVGERLSELLRLDTCVVYSASPTGFFPIFVDGRGVPPGFAESSRLIGLLEESSTPVGLARWRRWEKRGRIDDLDSASLEALGSTLILPIHREDDLAAIVCLGEKHSGDIFTASELTLLAGIADRTGFALLRFDQREQDEEVAEMREALRRYVPDAVASQLEQGTVIEPGSREVSVLFIDLRGYTTFSESRSPDEIFAMINAYTRAVSNTVRSHGGAIVDFQGDGLFAVFGAPEALADKEKCALRAGLEALEVVANLEVGGAPTTGQLRAGIGIATGDAYVGNIEASDRTIWGVIGNTTNLAARLQGLTRDLEADLVIDETTWERAGEGIDFRVCAATHVKGRSDALDLYSYCAPNVQRGGA